MEEDLKYCNSISFLYILKLFCGAVGDGKLILFLKSLILTCRSYGLQRSANLNQAQRRGSSVLQFCSLLRSEITVGMLSWLVVTSSSYGNLWSTTPFGTVLSLFGYPYRTKCLGC